MIMKIEKLLADDWQELDLGQPDWRWFIRGEENAYFYSLTGEVFFAKRWRDVVAGMPCWSLERGARLLKLYFVDTAMLSKKPCVVRGKIRKDSSNFRNLRESLRKKV